MAKQTTKLTMEEHTLSPRSREIYEAHIKRFDEWRGDQEITDIIVAKYLLYLWDKGLAPKTANLSIAAIRWRAEFEDNPDPYGRKAKATRRNYYRQAADEGDRGRGQADPVVWEQADAVAEQAIKDSKNLFGLRDAALVKTMSDGMLRPGEAVAVEVKHVNFEKETLLIPRSKTDQEGRGAVKYLGPPTLAYIRGLMEKGGITEGPLFRCINRNTHRPMKKGIGYSGLNKIIKSRCKAAGLTGKISGHSFRIGSAVSLAASGATDVQMQLDGRWKGGSGMPAHYSQKLPVSQSATARLRYGK